MIKKIVFTGDIMSFIPQNTAAWKNGRYDFTSIFQNVKPLFESADLVIGNLETPIAGEELGFTYEKTVFNTPIEFALAIKEAGVDIVTLANNHCFDRGYEGLKNTIDNLDRVGLRHTGCYKYRTDSDKPFVVELDGFRLSLLSFTYGTNSEWRGCVMDQSNDYMVDLFRKQDAQRVLPKGLIPSLKKFIKLFIPKRLLYKRYQLVIDDCVPRSTPAIGDERYIKKMNAKIKTAKENSDYVIMCMHSGGQFNDKVGEYTADLANRIISQGCNAIVGNHSHSILKFENIGDSPVVFSLGNFSWSPGYSVYRKDALSEYSILYNMYFDTENNLLLKITATLLKCIVQPDGGSIVYLVSDLHKTAKGCQRDFIEKDFIKAIGRLGKQVDCSDIDKREIVLKEYNRL